MSLTEKQKRFADEYLIDLNATRAYQKAYAGCKREETAAANASRMLRNAKVSGYIQKRMADRQRRTEITQDMVLEELAAIAFAKATDYAQVIERQAFFTTKEGRTVPLEDKNGKPLMIKDVDHALTEKLSDAQKRALQGIRNGKHGVEIYQCDKVRALELLGRHFGMFKERVEMSGMDGEKTKLDELIEQMRGGS